MCVRVWFVCACVWFVCVCVRFVCTLSPLARSFQNGWMKSQEPSFPVPSRVTRMAFFSSSAGRRLFTVRYLLLFMWSSCRHTTRPVITLHVRFSHSLLVFCCYLQTQTSECVRQGAALVLVLMSVGHRTMQLHASQTECVFEHVNAAAQL